MQLIEHLIVPGFTYDDATHTYYLGVRRIPGVTELLTALNFIQQNSWWTEEGRDKGTQLHRACAQINAGTFDWANADLGLLDEIFAYEEWKRRTGFKAILIETALPSLRYSFAGRLDMFGIFPEGSYAVIDIKRGIAGKATKYQLALYAQLICEAKIPGIDKIYPHQIKRFALSGFQEKPKLIPYEDRNDLKVALGLVSAFHAGFNDGIFALNSQPLEV